MPFKPKNQQRFFYSQFPHLASARSEHAKVSKLPEKTAGELNDDVKLRDYQERVRQKFLKNNLLVAHGTGSGKTVTSVASLLAADRKSLVAVPSSLVGNFSQTLDKIAKSKPDVQVESVGKIIARSIKPPQNGSMVIDESQMLRNPGTERTEYFRKLMRPDVRTMLLSATPMVNGPADIAPLVNMLHGKKVLPEGDEFNRRFVENRQVKPNFLGQDHGNKTR
jgi:SNF2 family DNA or RNA helicase